MPERFSGDPTLVCPVCKKPLEVGDHTDCKSIAPDKTEKKKDRKDLVREYHDLLDRAHENIETLSNQERERLAELGYHALEVDGNAYNAMRTFEALHDFEGLRKTADTLRRERDNWDLPEVLTFLEDNEGLRSFLNRRNLSPEGTVGSAFRPLSKLLFDYKHKFLEENKTPVATGAVNEGIDHVAIRNLSKHYDIAVPIARGGLPQGAIASFWGMPTRIVDIAAHNRKVPKGKWVNPVGAEDFAGKRVLLFDKDAVSGASVRKAVEMLGPFNPASIGIYFTHRVVPHGSMSLGGTRTEGLPDGLEIFSPHNAPLDNAGDAYIEAHEKLGTLYGRRRLIEQQYTHQIIPKFKEKYPDLVQTLELFISKQIRAFDSLNPYLPGIIEVRERILSRLVNTSQQCEGHLKSDLLELPGAMDKFKGVLDTTEPLILDFEEVLITARYGAQANKAAEKRGTENPHVPSYPLAAFHTARQAVKDGFDVALIVGPEGFAYEPYFHDLGLSTLAVNIPESGKDEPRSIQLFDDLSALEGRKVLVVEDDIRTGATLQKILEALKPHQPAHLGLYLGQPERFQIAENVPSDFKESYVAGTGVTAEALKKEFREYLESKGLRIFKNEKKPKKRVRKTSKKD